MSKKKTSNEPIPLEGYITAPLSQDITQPKALTTPNTSGDTGATSGNAAYLNSNNLKYSHSLSAGSATPVTDTSAITTTTKDIIVNFMTFSVISINSNGTTGSASFPYFDLIVNGVTIFRGALPQTCSDAQGVLMNQIIDVTDFFLAKGSTLKTLLGADSTGGNGYQSVITFGISGVSLN